MSTNSSSSLMAVCISFVCLFQAPTRRMIEEGAMPILYVNKLQFQSHGCLYIFCLFVSGSHQEDDRGGSHTYTICQQTPVPVSWLFVYLFVCLFVSGTHQEDDRGGSHTYTICQQTPVPVPWLSTQHAFTQYPLSSITSKKRNNS